MNRRWLAWALIAMPGLRAADLKPETVSAWDRSVEQADQAMEARLLPGHSFLWIDEAQERRQQARAGEILVTGVGEHNPKKVPSGLIHHWMGAAFVPNARVDDVLGVVRDYGHYKDYYNPAVIDSHTIERGALADRFTMLLMNKSVLLKTALESEYEASYRCAGDRKWYSTATAIHLQEVEDFGQANERKMPSGEGSGYVWKLHSIARYQEADGGVYVEVEAMALSRDIPAAVRWVVDPIVRRVSKGAIVTSLKQTMDAVNSSEQVASGRTVVSPAASSGFLPSSRH